MFVAVSTISTFSFLKPRNSNACKDVTQDNFSNSLIKWRYPYLTLKHFSPDMHFSLTSYHDLKFKKDSSSNERKYGHVYMGGIFKLLTLFKYQIVLNFLLCVFPNGSSRQLTCIKGDDHEWSGVPEEIKKKISEALLQENINLKRPPPRKKGHSHGKKSSFD